MRSLRRIVFVVVATLILVQAALPVAAATPETRQVSRSSGAPFQQLWSMLLSLWSPAAPPPTIDEGCIMDPLGRCREAAPTPDAGCIMDPLGRCL